MLFLNLMVFVNMELTTKEYWMCVIGPIESGTLRNGSDSPMRMAVAEAFEALPGCPIDGEGRASYILSSGWGLTEDQFNAVSEARNNTPSNLKRVVEVRKSINHTFLEDAVSQTKANLKLSRTLHRKR